MKGGMTIFEGSFEKSHPAENEKMTIAGKFPCSSSNSNGGFSTVMSVSRGMMYPFFEGFKVKLMQKYCLQPRS